jgi:hypothetical protein
VVKYFSRGFLYDDNNRDFKGNLSLPLVERRKIKKTLLEDTESTKKSKPQMSEDEFLQMLLAEGIISEIPEGITDEEDDFEPFEIEGEPISETIIKDRGE